MFNTILDLCFARVDCYAPYANKRLELDWSNKLNILQNHLNLYCSRADYKGLPDEFLSMTGKNRFWLVMKFFSPAVAWFKHEALGLQCLPVGGMKDYNIAGMPTKWTAFGADGTTYELSEKDSVLMFNDYAFSVPFLKMLYNVEMMLDCDKTHKQNLHAQRQPLLMEIEEDEKKSAELFLQKVKDSDTIIVRKRGSAKNGKQLGMPYDTKTFESGRQFQGDKLASDYRYFENRNLSMLGYNNENLEKKERLLVDEVNSNNEVVATYYTTALDCEQEAFDKINKMWGYNIQVVPRKLKRLKGEESNGKQNSAVQSGKTAEELAG